MPIKVECDICGKKYRLGDDRAGSTIPCKECGADIDVPGRALQSSGRRSSGRGSYRGSGGGSGDGQFVKWIVVGVAAAIAVVVAFVIVPRFLKDDPQPNEVAKNNGIAVQDNSSKSRKSRKSNGNGGGFDPNKQREEAKRRADEIRKRMQQASNNNKSNNNKSKSNGGGFQTSSNNNQANSGQNKSTGGFTTGNSNKGNSGFFNSTTPAAGWSVRADPASESVALDTDKEIKIKLPNDGGDNEVVFPNAPSPFVAVGGISFGNTTYEIWDLSTVKKVGEVKGKDLGAGALSPDGKHYACRFGGRFGKPQSILTLDIQAEKPLPEIKFDGDKTSATYLDFSNANRLVVIASVFGGESSIRTWTVPSMEPDKTIDFDGGINVKTATMSPGGRYLATMMSWDASLNIYDLERGRLAGKLETADLAKNTSCAGLAFSPNGEEIAGFFEGKFNNDSTLISWKLSTGKTTVTHALPKASGFDGAFFNKGRPLVWFPDSNKWLVLGRQVVDREAGGPIWSVPKDPTNSKRGERRVLDGKRVLAVTGERKARMLGAFPFPENLLTAGAEALKSGGKVADVGLPPIKNGDTSKVLSIDVSLSTPWKVKPQVDNSFDQELNADVKIDSSTYAIQSGFTSNTKAARAVIYKTKVAAGNNRNLPSRLPKSVRDRINKRKGGSSNTAKEGDPPVLLDVVDLVNAKVANSIAIGFDTELLSISSSGKFAALRLKNGQDRLDVFNLDSGDHVAAWRPFQDSPKGHKKIQFAAFLDDNLVLTVNNAGFGQDKERAFIVWSVPSCEAIYSLKGISQLAVSPDGKHIVIDFNNRLHFLDATSGEKTGELQVDGKPAAIAFHPRGDRVAAVYGTSVQVWLESWNLDGGESELRIPIPETAKALHWCGDNHLLLNNQRLIDLENEMVVWSFGLSNGMHIPTTPNGQHWYLIQSPQGRSTAILKAVELPDSKLASIISNVKPVRETVMEPGATVALQFTVPNPPGKNNFAKQLQDRWTSQLTKNGVKVGQSQNLKFVISSTESSTGKTQEYNTIGTGGGFKISVKQVKVSIRLMENNQPAWKFEQTFSNGQFFAMLKKGESPQNTMDNSMRNSAAQFLETFVPPSYVFSEEAAKGVGESILTINGPEVAASN